MCGIKNYNLSFSENHLGGEIYSCRKGQEWGWGFVCKNNRKCPYINRNMIWDQSSDNVHNGKYWNSEFETIYNIQKLIKINKKFCIWSKWKSLPFLKNPQTYGMDSVKILTNPKNEIIISEFKQ